MICVIQRVSEASVTVENRVISQIGPGMLVLLAVRQGDKPEDINWMARKLVTLRMFSRADRNFDLDVKETGGSILLVSNFTVAADAAKGRRPSLSAALDPAGAAVIFDQLVATIRALGIDVKTGEFGADMKISLINDGPVTFLLDSHNKPA